MRGYEVAEGTRPKGDYRAAVVGCGRMGSTIDDEHIGMSHYPWPWAHAPAIIEARGVDRSQRALPPQQRAGEAEAKGEEVKHISSS